jgi:hypothetical protein
LLKGERRSEPKKENETIERRMPKLQLRPVSFSWSATGSGDSNIGFRKLSAT